MGGSEKGGGPPKEIKVQVTQDRMYREPSSWVGSEAGQSLPGVLT